MSLPRILIRERLGTTENWNVQVTTSNCQTTTLALFAREVPDDPATPIEWLNIVKNGTARFHLARGHYRFGLSFQNVNGGAVVDIAVVTRQAPSTSPSPVAQSSAPQALAEVSFFDVFV